MPTIEERLAQIEQMIIELRSDNAKPFATVQPSTEPLDYREALAAAFDSYTEMPVPGMKTALNALGDGMATLISYNGKNDPVARSAAIFLRNFAESMKPSAADELEWERFFAEAVKLADQYEGEPGRPHPLTFAEMLRCLGMALREHLRNGAGAIESPTGDKNCANFGYVLNEFYGDLMRIASYLGCRRSPRIPFPVGVTGDTGWVHTPGGD